MKHSLLLAGAAVTLSLAPAVRADHNWNGYHWASTVSPFTLTLINSTTSEWDPFVTQAVADWSLSSRLTLVESEGDTSSKTRRSCKGGSGGMRICNLAYGYNGWLGVAGISVDGYGHITSAYTKLNDSYFSPGYANGYYDTFEWRQSVTCQELGHDLGLDHQDEVFDNLPLFTCMDYQDPPYPYPNAHDYEELDSLYSSPDSYDSYAGGASGGGGDSGGCNAPQGKGCNKAGVEDHPGWGISVSRRGDLEVFLRIDSQGLRHYTFVHWVKEHRH